jgi:LysR family transcriptional regulator, glycine cleavage system transcriptional activator
VSLRPAGQDDAASVRDVSERLIGTGAAARAQQGRRTVQLRAQFSIATMFLLPHVLSFTRVHSDVEIQLTALNFDRHPSKGGADIAVYHQRSPVEGYTQQVLLGGRYKIYAAPALLAHCDIRSPPKFLAAPFLHTRGAATSSPTAASQAPSLRDWLLLAGVQPPQNFPGMVFNLEHLTAAACAQGAGFALLLDELVLDSARAESLVALPGPTIANPSPYTLMKKSVAKDEVVFVSEWLIRHARV